MNQQITKRPKRRLFFLFTLIFLTVIGCVPSTTDVSSNETQEIEGETRIYGGTEEEANDTQEANDTLSSEEDSNSSGEEAVEGSSRSLDESSAEEGSDMLIEEGEHTIYVGDQPILDAFAAERSDMLIEAAGEVERVLSDDLEGSRHQRFILRLAADHTVLVAHNIDLAPKVPLSEGDWVELRGEYEWNPQGGVIHWTHHDPDGRHLDGWILYNDEYYE